MKKQELKISFTSFQNTDELNKKDQKLVEKAIEATKTAYAPYSEFYVGAALQLANGKIIIGSNQENSAYPSGLCAERVALFQAGTLFPDIAIETLVITARTKGKKLKTIANPCGACRQVMSESTMRQNKPFRIILIGENGQGYIFDSVDALLPFSFKFE
ncbi:MAG TPA: cytidine deaminase [Bacteroidales bacterium]|nr:cytidine deaminase [Bacteroidales bacterium]HPF00208.1 cytidine deaminase [Bacteroidales bacterium]